MKKVIQLFVVFSVIASFAFEKSNNSITKQINVVIDVSHGGSDLGAIVKSVSEKKIIEQIAKKIKSSNKNVKIHFTRNEDKFLSLEDRVHFINQLKPDLVLSIHINANLKNDKSGLEFYISNENEFTQKSTEIAKGLSHKLSKNALFKISELKTAPFFILKKSQAPAVLVELGYLTNENDFKHLTDDKTQGIIANSISEYISELQ